MTNGEAKPGAFSRGFRREEGIEHLFFHFRWNTSAVITDSDFHTIAKALGRGSKGWHVISPIRFRLAPGRCIKAVRDQVQKCPRDVLREQVRLACRLIKGPLQGNVEALFLGPCPVPGEIEAFIDESIDINNPVLTRAFARM